MPGSVQELTGTLLSAVDQEGNVKDMTVVLEVVKALESSTVTAEDLKVTRLGKFINLIRRKVVDVDKQLSKRLKNLVKQWQQLVPKTKVPNGVVQPPPSTSSSLPAVVDPPPSTLIGTPPPSTPSSSSLLLKSQSSSEGHSSLSVHTTPSPSNSQPSLPLDSSASGSLPLSSASQTKNPSPQQTSFLSPPEHSTSSSSVRSRPNSRGPPSHSRTPTPTPTPSMSTHSARPVHPVVSETPAWNRSKMLHKLSSFKTSGGNSHVSQKEEAPVIKPEIASENPLALHSTGGTGNEGGGVASRMNASRLISLDDEMPQSLWSSDSFMDMDFLAGNDTPWDQNSLNNRETPPTKDQSPVAFNGTSLAEPRPGTSHSEGSRKRSRSSSPLEQPSLSALAPLNKKHKPHKNSSSSRSRAEAGPLEFVVRIPLERVFIKQQLHNHHQNHTAASVNESPSVNEGVNSFIRGASAPVVVVEEADVELVVSIRKCYLSRIPTSGTIGLRCGSPVRRTKHKKQHKSRGDGTSSERSQLTANRQMRDPSSPTPWQASNAPNLPDLTDILDHYQSTAPLPRPQPSATPTNNTATDGNKLPVPSLPARLQRPAPEGACLGVDGCMGPDGYWYDWTEHIDRYGEEVTIMPYVYYEDDRHV